MLYSGELKMEIEWNKFLSKTDDTGPGIWKYDFVVNFCNFLRARE